MKKILFLFLVSMISINAFSQIGFPWGIEKWISKEEFKKIMKEKTSCTFSFDKENKISYDGGSIGGESIDFVLASFYEDKLFRVMIKLSDVSGNKVLPQFNSIKSNYSKKYGRPMSELEKYYYPYEKGDGHEATAIKTGNTEISTLWKDDSGSILIYIMNKGYTVITYDDSRFSNIVDDERTSKQLDEI